MTDCKITQTWWSDWYMVIRLNELVAEAADLKALIIARRKGRKGMDYKKKCKLCNDGEPEHATTDNVDSPHCIFCKVCLQRVGGITKAIAERRWVWLQSMCDEVTPDFVAKIAAAVPEGRTLEPNICDVEMYRTYKTESVGSGESSRNVPDDMSHISISFAFRDEPLTGKAWAAKQTCGTMFEIAGSWWLFVISIRNFMIIIRDGKCVGDQPCWVDGKWENWPDCLDPVCDAHVIHRPKGGK